MKIDNKIDDIIIRNKDTKYEQRIHSLQDNIFQKFPELQDTYQYQFQNPYFGSQNPFDNYDGKAHVFTNTNTIVLDEVVLKANEKRLLGVLIHEMLHCKHPDWSEEQIVKQTQQYVSKMQSTFERALDSTIK